MVLPRPKSEQERRNNHDSGVGSYVGERHEDVLKNEEMLTFSVSNHLTKDNAKVIPPHMDDSNEYSIDEPRLGTRVIDQMRKCAMKG